MAANKVNGVRAALEFGNCQTCSRT
jgi:ribose 5-phosphate isomerase RpiB